MKKPMKKGVKIFLIVLIVMVLLGICFAFVALYAHREFTKEKSWLPPEFPPQEQSVTDLPDNAHDAYEYVMRLYNEALHASHVEGSWHTDVDLSGEIVTPFSETDAAIISMIRDGAAGQIQSLYPNVNGVRMTDEKADDLPEITLEEADVLEYVYTPDTVFNRRGEYVSDEYEIVFKVDPAFEKTDDILHGEIYNGICERLKDAMTVDEVDLETQEVEIRFVIDRLSDEMLRASVSRSYAVHAKVTLSDDYADLLENGEKTAEISLPYRATEQVSFKWYGMRFTEPYLETNPDDIITLPLDIRVNDASVQGEDFVLTFTPDDPETMTIEPDGLMTVRKTNAVSETDGVKLKAKMEYDGLTFEDEIIIYITELDKTTAGVRFWKDAAEVPVGKTVLLPADIRVPVNEQADNRDEEEYELIIEVSDPEALEIEQDDKDLYATAKKQVDGPVTVSVTMKCGGHTYSAELPVTITLEKEAENNG